MHVFNVLSEQKHEAVPVLTICVCLREREGFEINNNNGHFTCQRSEMLVMDMKLVVSFSDIGVSRKRFDIILFR